MPTTCQFEFSRATPIYYSGEQISGSIILRTTKRLSVEAIQIFLVGTERVEWLERNREAILLHNDSTEQDNKLLFSDKRELFCESYTLAKHTCLQAGEIFAEKFSFTLPHEAPASYNTKYGEIFYCVRLILQRTSIFNKVFETRCIIKNRIDLCASVELSEPQTIKVANTKSSDVQETSLLFTVCSGTGYVPGQNIIYTISGRHRFSACNRLRVNLCQLSTFRATKSQMKVRESLIILNRDTRKISSSYVMACGQLNIPLLTHISLPANENNLIKICHYLEAMLTYKKRILQKFIIPITVGTIPPKRVKLSELEQYMEGAQQNHCYDNLATDAVGDRLQQNIYVKDYSTLALDNIPSDLILKAIPSSGNLLKTNLISNNCQTRLCSADICNHN
ncbi:arrestin domain-containing protein 5 [Ceratitis capitata]|nr:arrestin domain-containing protein 5 [Ceratitis capitata]CAD6995992.1 unnamed protein product [Ceratitis capitata]